MNNNIKKIRYSVECERIISKTLKEVVELDISKYNLNCKIADIIISFLSKVYEEYIDTKHWQDILTCLNEDYTYLYTSDNIKYEIKKDTENNLVIINVYDIKVKDVIYNFEKIHEENNQ